MIPYSFIFLLKFFQLWPLGVLLVGSCIPLTCPYFCVCVSTLLPAHHHIYQQNSHPFQALGRNLSKAYPRSCLCWLQSLHLHVSPQATKWGFSSSSPIKVPKPHVAMCNVPSWPSRQPLQLASFPELLSPHGLWTHGFPSALRLFLPSLLCWLSLLAGPFSSTSALSHEMLSLAVPPGCWGLLDTPVFQIQTLNNLVSLLREQSRGLASPDKIQTIVLIMVKLT